METDEEYNARIAAYERRAAAAAKGSAKRTANAKAKKLKRISELKKELIALEKKVDN